MGAPDICQLQPQVTRGPIPACEPQVALAERPLEESRTLGPLLWGLHLPPQARPQPPLSLRCCHALCTPGLLGQVQGPPAQPWPCLPLPGCRGHSWCLAETQTEPKHSHPHITVSALCCPSPPSPPGGQHSQGRGLGTWVAWGLCGVWELSPVLCPLQRGR